MLLKYININDIGEKEEELVRRILPKRYEKSQRYKQKDDVKRCLGAGVLLIKELGITEETVLFENENGKPFAKGFLPFSISHSGDFVVIAIGDSNTKQIGCDIEEIKERNLKVGERVFSPEELTYMSENDSVNRFHELWTKKESVVKALGFTIFENMKSLSVLGNCCHYQDENINLESFVLSNYWVSVAKIVK